jgi:hypothetical protein
MEWIGLIWLKGPLESSCEHGIETLGSEKSWEVLEWLPKKG